MAKSKKSKILAMALCAGVMAGIYASPVMAADANASFDSVSGNIEFTIDGVTCRINENEILEVIKNNYIHTNGSVTANAGFIARSGYFAFVGDTQYAMLANKEYFALGDNLIMGAQDNEKKARFYVDNRTGNVRTKGDVTTLKADGTENYTLNTIGANTAGITRKPLAGSGNTTYIEENTAISADGIVVTDPDSSVSTKTKYDGFYVKDETGNNVSRLTKDRLDLAGKNLAVADSEGNIDVSASDVSASTYTAGDDAAENVRVKSDGIYVKNGGTIVSSLTKDKLNLAGENLAYKDSEGNINVTADTYTADTYTAGEVAGENVRVKADGIYVKNGGTIVSSLKDDGLMLTDQDSGESHTLNATDIADIKGIDRDIVEETFGDVTTTTKTTTIEGALKVSDNGFISNANESFTVDANGTLTAAGGRFTVSDVTGAHFYGSDSMFSDYTNINGGRIEINGADGSQTVINGGKVTSTGDFITLDEDGKQKYTLNTIGVDLDTLEGNVETIGKNVGGISREGYENAAYGEGRTEIEDLLAVNGVEGKVSVMGKDGTVAVITKDGTARFGVETGKNLRWKNGELAINSSGEEAVASLSEEGLMLSDEQSRSQTLNATDIADIKGIDRDIVEETFGDVTTTTKTTTIEGTLKVSDNGLISNADGSFTVDSNGGLVAGGGTFAADMTGIRMSAPVQMTLQGDYNYKGQSVIDLGITISDIDDRLDVLEDKTQNIKPGTGAGTGTGEGGTAAGEGNNIIDVPATEDGHTGITGDVTVGGEINAGEIVVGDKDSDNKTTINGGTITTGDTTITGTGITTGTGTFTGDVDVDGEVTVGENTTITGEGITTGTGTFTGDVDVDGKITAGTGTIGNVDMNNNGITVGGGTTITKDTVTTDNIKADYGDFGSQVTVGDNTTITNGNINLGGDNGTNINAEGMIVGNANGVNTNVSAGDVVITDKDGKDIALSDVGYVENIDRELQANGNYDETVVGGINAEADIRRAEVNRLDNRISKVEDRVDKVGAMSAAIANLRTMGYDPAAPTEIAVGVGQYRSETGVALGMFHYPNRDFMLSLSVSTSGDEVMGGIGATWKFGRKSPEKVAEIKKAQAEADARRAEEAKLAKAEEMKQAAKEAKIKAQQERHAKLAAERAAQAEAAK